MTARDHKRCGETPALGRRSHSETPPRGRRCRRQTPVRDRRCWPETTPRGRRCRRGTPVRDCRCWSETPPRGPMLRIQIRILIRMVPSEPYVFGPPGSGSGSSSQRYGSGAKLVRKTSILTVLWVLLTFLSLKNYVNVPSKSNKQKKFTKN